MRGRHPKDPHAERIRQQIAAEAARLVAEEAISDLGRARRKAIERLRLQPNEAQLPGYDEISAALHAHWQLFHRDTQPARLRVLREAAVAAMEALSAFHPRLTGDVLEGTADAHSRIHLHVFSDEPEAPIRVLDEYGIRHRSGALHVWLNARQQTTTPTLTFELEGIAYALSVFPLNGLRQSPQNAETGHPIPRAGIGAVRQLLKHASD